MTGYTVTTSVSITGVGHPVIDCMENGVAFTASGVGVILEMRGFTVRNCRNEQGGGGLTLDGAEGSLTDMIFSNHQCITPEGYVEDTTGGGAIRVLNGGLLGGTRLTVRNNTATGVSGRGGGVLLDKDSSMRCTGKSTLFH